MGRPWPTASIPAIVIWTSGGTITITMTITNLEAWKLRNLEDFARGQSRRDVFAFRPLTCWFRHRLHLSPIDLRAAAGSAIVFALRSLTCWFRHRLSSFSLLLRAADGSAIVFAFLARR